MALTYKKLRTGFTILSVALLSIGCEFVKKPEPIDALSTFVNPLTGTGAGTTASALRHSEADNEPRGQTFPAVGVPFGMTQWTPQTRDGEEKCVVPYYFSDTHIQGFRGSHWMSGSCTQDYGSVTIMPMAGPPRTDPVERAVSFSHDTETASPSYYRVMLDDYNIEAEITGVTRSGIMRFTFQEREEASFVIQPNSDEGLGSVEINPERNEICGSNPAHRIYQGWGESAGFSGHFVAVFDRSFKAYGTWFGGDQQPGGVQVDGDGSENAAGGFVQFDIAPGEVIHVKVGTSFSSIEQARKNLNAEIPNWGFEDVRSTSETSWNKALGTVSLTGGTEKEREMFYTALYHTMMLPRVFSDVDGTYTGFADDVRNHTADGYNYYVDFSLWDTYRAVHPLLTILAPDRARDMVRSLFDKAEQGGWMPTFPSWNSYTSAMIGDHAIPVIVDAFLKGIDDFDVEGAYDFMWKNATRTPDYAEYLDGKGRRALQPYLEYGYLAIEEPVNEAFHKEEQVSRTLEYAFDDYVLSQMAESLGRDSDHRALLQRAASFRNVIDPQTGYARGRHADGRWSTPFNPLERKYRFITEGTPFHYTWYVPHDVEGLIEILGGRDQFIARLDTFFTQEHYWHGNEPSHHIAYLYNYAGAPWKTQERVRAIMEEEYGTGPGGLSGNDDAGQMSAWYAFSAMGLYPVAPGLPYYAIGSPLFEEIILNLSNGNAFVIRAEGSSAENKYIQSATLNGKLFDQPWIEHASILAGGMLVFQMGAEPEPVWGSDPNSAPPSMTTSYGATTTQPVE